MKEGLYEELGRHLDRAVAGVPMSPRLMEILRILYPGEEAEVALELAIYENRTLEDVEAALPHKAGRLQGLLEEMAHRGTVFTEHKPGRERIYRLLPSIVGFVEVPFLDGVDTPTKRELARLWSEYIDEGFGEEMARGMPLIRVVPIAESLEDSSQVLPFDAIAAKLEKTTFMAVGHCPCRQIGKYTGKGCDRPTERCMHFGSLGRYMVEVGKARELTRGEALAMLRSATEEGLVHVCDNLEGSLRTICNCCPCCCGFFRVRSQRGLDTVARSNYVARVDADGCTGCGTCVERCPVDAVAVEDGIARVDEEACIGCGVCAPTCGGNEAISLRRREEMSPPPDLESFLAARMKA